jgi:hypothetical protein
MPIKRGRSDNISVYERNQHTEEDKYMRQKADEAEAEYSDNPPRPYLFDITATDYLKRFFYFTLERLVGNGGIEVLDRDATTKQPTHFKIINGEISGHAFDPIFLPETTRLISRSPDHHHRSVSLRWFHLGWRAVNPRAPRVPSAFHPNYLSKYLTDYTFRLHPLIFSIKGMEFKYFNTQNPIFQNSNHTYYLSDAFNTSAIEEQLTAILRRRSDAPGIDALKRQKILRDIQTLSPGNAMIPRKKMLHMNQRASEPIPGPSRGDVFDDIDPRLLTIPRDYDSERDVSGSSSEEEILLTSRSDYDGDWEGQWATDLSQADAAIMDLPKEDQAIIHALESTLRVERMISRRPNA